MLGRMRKRKRMDNYEFQALRDIVKEGGDDVVERFEKKFKDGKVEGKRKNISTVLYSGSDHDCLLESKYTKEELEALYMGTQSEARKQFQMNGLYQRRQYIYRRQRFILRLTLWRKTVKV